MFNICFIHNLAEVDHSKFVSSRCYAPRAMTTPWGGRPQLPSPQSCIDYYLFSCSCSNLLLYIPLILSYLHNEERGEIKDGDGCLTFQRKDGPPWQSSNLHLIDLKEFVFIFSCSFLIPYADLNRRESDGDRGPATQRVDGPLWQSSNSCPMALKTQTYNISCSKIFSCTLCYHTFIKYKRTYEIEDGGCGLVTIWEDKPPHPSPQSCTKLLSCSCTCVNQIQKIFVLSMMGESLTTPLGGRPPHPSSQSCINHYSCSCSCINIKH